MAKPKVPNKVKKLFSGPDSGGHVPTEYVDDGYIDEAFRQACIMEFVNLISPKYEVWGTDAPCVDRTLTSMSIEVNDEVTDGVRDALLKYAPRYLGTKYRKNHGKMAKGAYEWALYAQKKGLIPSEQDDYVWDRKTKEYTHKMVPVKIRKKDFSSWTKASTKLTELWNHAQYENALQEEKLIKEFTKLLDFVLPEGECEEPNWDRAKAYGASLKSQTPIEIVW